MVRGGGGGGRGEGDPVQDHHAVDFRRPTPATSMTPSPEGRPPSPPFCPECNDGAASRRLHVLPQKFPFRQWSGIAPIVFNIRMPLQSSRHSSISSAKKAHSRYMHAMNRLKDSITRNSQGEDYSIQLPHEHHIYHCWLHKKGE